MDLYSGVEMDNRKTPICNRDGIRMNMKGKQMQKRIWIFCYVVPDPGSQACILNLLSNAETNWLERLLNIQHGKNDAYELLCQIVLIFLKE